MWWIPLISEKPLAAKAAKIRAAPSKICCPDGAPCRSCRPVMMAARSSMRMRAPCGKFLYVHITLSKTVSVITLVPRASVRRAMNCGCKSVESGVGQCLYVYGTWATTWTNPQAASFGLLNHDSHLLELGYYRRQVLGDYFFDEHIAAADGRCSH